MIFDVISNESHFSSNANESNHMTAVNYERCLSLFNYINIDIELQCRMWRIIFWYKICEYLVTKGIYIPVLNGQEAFLQHIFWCSIFFFNFHFTVITVLVFYINPLNSLKNTKTNKKNTIKLVQLLSSPSHSLSPLWFLNKWSWCIIWWRCALFASWWPKSL
jgi:hypothetical protein